MQKERATLESISEHRVFQTVSTGQTISPGVQSVEDDVALRNVEMPLKGLCHNSFQNLRACIKS